MSAEIGYSQIHVRTPNSISLNVVLLDSAVRMRLVLSGDFSESTEV